VTVAGKCRRRHSANAICFAACVTNDSLQPTIILLCGLAILTVVGGIAMLLGAVDPLEGSLLILPGSALLAFAMFLGKRARRTLIYWLWVFILIAVGVGAMSVLSAFGGIGVMSGRIIPGSCSFAPPAISNRLPSEARTAQPRRSRSMHRAARQPMSPRSQLSESLPRKSLAHRPS
jgi:hypothetical protein